MNKKLEIWQFAAEKLKQNEPVMLLVVAESKGSSPGRQGFKMIVAENELAGSIGGGVMEVQMAETARWKMENGKWKIAAEDSKSEIRNPKSKIVEQVHRRNVANPSGMICSGRQTVIFFELNREHLRTIRKIIQYLENGRERFLQITSNDLRLIWKKEFDKIDFRFEKTGENDFLYEERLGFKNKLHIIGGGHCALALSEIMAKLDFHISLFDDRADLNTLAKNRFVHEKKIIDSYENIGEFIEGGENVYAVVMTLGFKFDEIVIRRLFDKKFKYFGVLGSKAKMKTLLRNLEKEGFKREKLSQIRTPVGLEIGSRTPEEIAVSIAAEIISVKNNSIKNN